MKYQNVLLLANLRADPRPTIAAFRNFSSGNLALHGHRGFSPIAASVGRWLP
jgi:hypothetical protein